jgi:hypothetical protein
MKKAEEDVSIVLFIFYFNFCILCSINILCFVCEGKK